jgi:hypothetical protein
MKTTVPSAKLWLCVPLLAGALLGSVGCGKSESHSDHDHGKLHVHTAPHGGTLIELGEHEANLELVRDANAGKLTAYLLDGHAENFLRVPLPGFQLTAMVAGKSETLNFQAVANTATGEKVGDTSQFEAQADWLKTTAEFQGSIAELPVRTKIYKALQVKFPK